MSKLEEIREEFKKDRFATDAVGIRIDCAEPGKAVCSLTLKPHHMNANNVPMGGAIFTLADFTCAVAANGYSERMTVSQNASITFLALKKGRAADRGGVLPEKRAHYGAFDGGYSG